MSGRTALQLEKVRRFTAAAVEVAAAASDYAKLVQVERFPIEDMAVTRAYERLRLAIDRLATQGE